MRTTVNIDEHLLTEVKLMAARTRRTVGSLLEDALQKLIDDNAAGAAPDTPFRLPRFHYSDPAVRQGVDLSDLDALLAAPAAQIVRPAHATG